MNATMNNNPVSLSASRLLACNLRRLRVSHGVSQKRLAANAEIARGYISRIERALENPTLRMLDRLATALCVPMVEFFADPGKSELAPERLHGGRPKKLAAGDRGSAESPPQAA